LSTIGLSVKTPTDGRVTRHSHGLPAASRYLGTVLLSLEKMKFIRIVLFSLTFSPALAQPSTEVYIFDLQKVNGNYEVTNPVNVSSNPGLYDNQPSFSVDSQTLYYVSQDTSKQTDIFFFDIVTGSKTNFSNTSASEYSPTLTPDGKYVSCIRVVGEQQLLWKFELSTKVPQIIIPDLVVGYHCWWSENTLVTFVLGEPQTLQINKLETKTNKIVANDIGRSLYNIPGTRLVSFLQNRDNLPPLVQSLDPASGEIKNVAEALADSQDMAWTPNGEILMAQAAKLFMWSPDTKVWKQVADLEAMFGLKGVTRIAVDPNSRKLALVVNE